MCEYIRYNRNVKRSFVWHAYVSMRFTTNRFFANHSCVRYLFGINVLYMFEKQKCVCVLRILANRIVLYRILVSFTYTYKCVRSHMHRVRTNIFTFSASMCALWIFFLCLVYVILFTSSFSRQT